jgi:hypothetical protein
MCGPKKDEVMEGLMVFHIYVSHDMSLGERTLI